MERVTGAGIRVYASFMVGFPGETEADFAATMKLIEDIGFDLSFSFVYSARPGTPEGPANRRAAGCPGAALCVYQGRYAYFSAIEQAER